MIYTQFIFPIFFQNLISSGSGDSNDFANNKIEILILIIFGFLITAAVFYAVLAGWQYVRSQGDQSQIDAATKAIQAIIMGVGAMAVAIIGIVLVFVFFTSTIFKVNRYQSCKKFSSGMGCMACSNTDGGLPAEWQGMKAASKNPELGTGILIAKGVSFGQNTKISSQQVCTFCEWEIFHKDSGGDYPHKTLTRFVCLE